MTAEEPVDVHIFAGKTWGAMGNFLAASHLGSVLSRSGPYRTAVFAIEEFVPWAADAGRTIKQLSLEATHADDLHRRYLSFADSCEHDLPAGFEVAGGASPIDVSALLDHLDRSRPDIVVATKGVISRMLTWCVRHLGLPTRVWNYYTNPGLFEMAMHRAPHMDATTVPFAWNRDRLCALTGLGPDQVVVTGQLLAARSMPTASHDEAAGRPLIMVFNNRCGEMFTELVADLASRATDAHLVYVAVDQVDSVDRIRPLCDARGWTIYERLPQDRYLGYLRWAERVPGSFLVSKASPATVFEAVDRQIPMIAVPSGLPQETWVPGLIADEQLGLALPDTSEVTEAARAWLDGNIVRKYREGARGFRTQYLDQPPAEGRVLQVADRLRRPRTD